ncbi:MAG: hypothetical protein U9Q73_02620 [Nanoarchaeota archaeon]|nr:hypothetical protein [Nanoarchaeota archaeon]
MTENVKKINSTELTEEEFNSFIKSGKMESVFKFLTSSYQLHKSANKFFRFRLSDEVGRNC